MFDIANIRINVDTHLCPSAQLCFKMLEFGIRSAKTEMDPLHGCETFNDNCSQDLQKASLAQELFITFGRTARLVFHEIFTNLQGLSKPLG